MNIPAEELVKYGLRENEYDLIKTEYNCICPELWNKIHSEKKHAFVLTAKDSALHPDGKPFLAYHENTRNWAYKLGKHFGEMFDKTTYCNKWKVLHK